VSTHAPLLSSLGSSGAASAATAASTAPSLSAIGSSLLTADLGRGTDVAAAGLVRGTAVAVADAAVAAAATDGDPDRPGDEGAATAGGVVTDPEPTAVAGGVVMGSSSRQYVFMTRRRRASWMGLETKSDVPAEHGEWDSFKQWQSYRPPGTP